MISSGDIQLITGSFIQINHSSKCSTQMHTKAQLVTVNYQLKCLKSQFHQLIYTKILLNFIQSCSQRH